MSKQRTKRVKQLEHADWLVLMASNSSKALCSVQFSAANVYWLEITVHVIQSGTCPEITCSGTVDMADGNVLPTADMAKGNML